MAGIHILHKLKIQPIHTTGGRASLPPAIRHYLQIKPIPKNTLAGRHDTRKKLRADRLSEKHKQDQTAVFVDAANQGHNTYTLSVVNAELKIVNVASTRAASIKEAEEIAIALPIMHPTTHTLLSDSTSAILSFVKGSVGLNRAKVLRNCNQNERIKMNLVWVPTHSGNPGNEAAHKVGRGLANRVALSLEPGSPVGEAVAFYNELTNMYKDDRRLYPIPHSNLTRAQATILRRIQTDSLTTPHRLAIFSGGEVDSTCENCDKNTIANQSHILWECEGLPPPRELLPGPSETTWETLIQCPDEKLQKAVIAWAQEVAADKRPARNP
ncbi:hypothetical protein HPB51_027422 [Rhipicephalus microplus]|uniref:Tick transposon n=1 Tax=Rhipicephalus microplus TaxID=6941 RepID=A0A9J6D0A8_RHIMP|nr:hypothetical protein HPB51_027422 [Rhipicephalus microplus]